jgi:signal transduction histidine kinase/DNA-binding response OmpR family regulator
MWFTGVRRLCRNIPRATVLDGYGSAQVELEKGPRPFERLFGEAGGWTWGVSPEGFRILQPPNGWITSRVEPLAGALIVQPLGGGKTLVVRDQQVYEHDFANNRTQVLWDGRAAQIGVFSEILGDPERGLWIAGASGVGRLLRGAGAWQWTEFRHWPEPLTRFRQLGRGDDGDVFVTATTAPDRHVVLRYDTAKWSVIHRTAKPDSRAWRGGGDTVWIKEGNALFCRSQGRLQPIDRSAVPSDAVRDVAPEPGGAFWLATNDGVARNAPRLWRAPDGAPALGATVFRIRDDRAGGLWLLTEDALIHHSGDRWEAIPFPREWTPLVLRNSSLLVLRDGSLALPRAGKIGRFDPRTRSFSEVSPPGGLFLEMMTPRGDGTAWTVTRNRDQSRIQLGIFDGEFHPRPDLDFDWKYSGVLTVQQTSSGAIWIGGTNELSVFENGALRVVGRDAGYADTGAIFIAEIQPGRVWVGGRSKLMEYDGLSWKVLRNTDRVRMIVPARDGSVWIAASDGVYRYKDGSWLDYGREEGLPSEIVYAIHEDARGRIWAGTTLGSTVLRPEADPDPPRAYIQSSQNLSQVGYGEVRLLFSGADKWKYTDPDRLLFSYRIDGQEWSRFAPGRPAVYDLRKTGGHRFEVRAMDRNGNISPQPAAFEFTVVPPWYLSAGFLSSFVLGAMVILILATLLARNYTHRGRLISQLSRARAEADVQREEAERASRAKSLFLANMSHEIRTPMNGVLGMAELARDAETNAEREEYLGAVQSSARSLLTILNDILDFSKIEADKVDLVAEPFHLRACIADALRPVTPAAGEQELELVVRVAPDVPDLVVGDSVRLRQVLLNILGNAVKFTRDGEIALDVSVEEPAADAPLLRFVVRDTGIGIPPDKQKVIFQAFEQADGSTNRRFGGTGLGLAISARLVERMGGRIEVASPAEHPAPSTGGPGSEFRFHIRLPLAEPAAAPPPARPLRDTRVLVVEDNASSRAVLSEILVREGVTVTTAVSCGDARARLSAALGWGSLFDAVIVDRSLPDGDGWDLARELRATPAYAAVRLIVLNSPGRPTKSQPAGDDVIDALLHKPVAAAELVRTLAVVLQPAGSTSVEEPREAPAERRPRLRVLVAEDNPVNQLVTRRLLEKRGHDVEIARDGRQAVAAFDRGGFDLILMDVQMPVVDGWEATAAIRLRERANGGHRLPIVALTAHAMKGDEDRCLDAGMDGYITKPIELAALDAWIEKVSRDTSGD